MLSGIRGSWRTAFALCVRSNHPIEMVCTAGSIAAPMSLAGVSSASTRCHRESGAGVAADAGRLIA